MEVAYYPVCAVTTRTAESFWCLSPQTTRETTRASLHARSLTPRKHPGDCAVHKSALESSRFSIPSSLQRHALTQLQTLLLPPPEMTPRALFTDASPQPRAAQLHAAGRAGSLSRRIPAAGSPLPAPHPAPYLHVPREVHDVMLRRCRAARGRRQQQQQIVGPLRLRTHHLRQPQPRRAEPRWRETSTAAATTARGSRGAGGRRPAKAHAPAQAEGGGADQPPQQRSCTDPAAPAHGAASPSPAAQPHNAPARHPPRPAHRCPRPLREPSNGGARALVTAAASAVASWIFEKEREEARRAASRRFWAVELGWVGGTACALPHCASGHCYLSAELWSDYLYTLLMACWPHPVFAEWCGGDRAQLMLCVALPENSAGLKISEEKLGSICFWIYSCDRGAPLSEVGP